MKLTVLVDNNTIIDQYYLGEPGLSFFIEDEIKDIRILFDTGYSDVFIKNADKMGIDLSDITHIILSHGHEDHTWGLQQYIDRFGADLLQKAVKPKLIAHPLCLAPKVIDHKQIGMLIQENELRKYFDLVLSTEPVWLNESLVFLGEIARVNSFENRNPIGITQIDGMDRADYLLDDTALAYKTEVGLFVIPGCAHSGICNIIEHAKKVFNEADKLNVPNKTIKPPGVRVKGLIGGLHLLDPGSELLDRTMEYLANTGIKEINACHCTDLASKIALSKVADIVEIGVGKVVEIK